jgi:hypothetical protein
MMMQRYKKNMHNNRLHVVKNTTCSAINYILGCICGFKQPPTPNTKQPSPNAQQQYAKKIQK